MITYEEIATLKCACVVTCGRCNLPPIYAGIVASSLANGVTCEKHSYLLLIEDQITIEDLRAKEEEAGVFYNAHLNHAYDADFYMQIVRGMVRACKVMYDNRDKGAIGLGKILNPACKDASSWAEMWIFEWVKDGLSARSVEYAIEDGPEENYARFYKLTDSFLSHMGYTHGCPEPYPEIVI